jgi:hypothetical protein
VCRGGGGDLGPVLAARRCRGSMGVGGLELAR